jgi:arabinosaccharide transport system substrate-binding protein
MYVPIVEEWNATAEREGRAKVGVTLMALPALERRLLSGFLADTPCADLLEVERRIAARAFTGPIESVGFADLTERLRAEGLDKVINPASFGPWSSRGRIFGLPHDVHPVMLGYRADLVEAAGIDVSAIETWEDFARAMAPLMAEKGADGKPVRYLLNLWETQGETIEALVLQAGGAFFDEEGRPVIDSERNARTVAQIVAWTNGPERIAAEAPDFSASGNRLKLEGYVVASVMPDWMCNIWKNEIPQLAGKVKLMPLPAWEKGGRRTSVWGGTMLGISRRAENFEELWAFAKALYLSPEVARRLYREGDIVTPVTSLWKDPVFDEPDAYFCGQSKGRMYIDLAPQVPVRASSPYNGMAILAVQDAVVALGGVARGRGIFTPEGLLPEARRVLRVAQGRIEEQLARNVFLRGTVEGAGVTP